MPLSDEYGEIADEEFWTTAKDEAYQRYNQTMTGQALLGAGTEDELLTATEAVLEAFNYSALMMTPEEGARPPSYSDEEWEKHRNMTGQSIREQLDEGYTLLLDQAETELDILGMSITSVIELLSDIQMSGIPDEDKLASALHSIAMSKLFLLQSKVANDLGYPEHALFQRGVQ